MRGADLGSSKNQANGRQEYECSATLTAVSGKVVLKKRKAYATIPKGSLGID